ncbi:hypothetical protein KC19_10G178800 [Ceratodon purpureus]|uniref:Uncharacterized protein n=1 Tax=Ceratodon purpureus TaxID=3225 RepID=A0A8T0GQB9_CERPU|nr:hypothetical protein KC19_10G178800 [Ceratodon purpureus]
MKESQSRVKKRSEERDDLETIKAAAWAVFQHNNGGGSNTNRHPGGMLVQQGPTRFKIEAQMKNELERRSMAKEALPSWDAGSTLFDKYELDSVFKHLDFAFQSVDTQQKVSFEGSDYYDEATAEPASNRYSNAHQYSYADQRSRNGYAMSQQERPNQGNWLETVDQSQRFRGSFLESVDESLPLANAPNAGYDLDVNGYSHEEPLKPKLALNMELYDEICRDMQEVVPQGKLFKTMQYMHTPNRSNILLNGRRCSFDTSPGDVQKESKQSRKSKLLAIFKSKSGKDGIPPKPTRQARIMPDDLTQKGRKTKTKDPLRKSGELVVKHVVADPHDSDSSDSINGDGYEAQEYPSKGAYNQVPALGLKSGLHMVVVPTFSRAVRLSSDMSNPNSEQGLRDHLRHGNLSYGLGTAATAPASPTGRRKGSYSLNVTSPVQTPRRSMLNGSREELDLDDTQQYHTEYHHHYHHHHHHIAHGQGDDYELTVQDIVRRVPRKSFEELAHRLSIEENTGVKAPRNSLESPFLSSSTPGSKLFL